MRQVLSRSGIAFDFDQHKKNVKVITPFECGILRVYETPNILKIFPVKNKCHAFRIMASTRGDIKRNHKFAHTHSCGE